MSIFNDRLKELRDNSGMASKDLAKKLGITESKLSYYMSGDREPSYELLIAIANEFDVTTDYLVGRSNQKRFEAEVLAQNIQSKSESTTNNTKRQAEIENESVRLHDILVKFANTESSDKKIDDIWQMISIWLDGLSSYYDFVNEYKSPNYPLDSAKDAMSYISKSRHIAVERVTSMLEEIITNNSVDKSIKDRIFINTSFGIKPLKTNLNNEDVEKADE